MNKVIVFVFLCCLSCKKHQEVEQEKVFDPITFKLINGELFLQDDLYSGVLIKEDSLNKVKTITKYNLGRKEGIEIKYYQDTLKIEERFYTEGMKSGIHRGWWRNGNLRFEYHFNPKGAYNGSVNEWYKNGQQMKAFNFENGKESGTQRLWQDDGKIRANFVAKNGDRFGLIGLKKCYSVNTVNEDYR